MRRLLIVLLLVPASGLGQDVSSPPGANAGSPPCGPAMDGQVMCRFGALYECTFIDPHSMNRRTGWRWSLDLLRSCDTAPAFTTLPNGDHAGLPPGFTYAPQYGAPAGQSSPQTLSPPRRSGWRD